MIQLIGLAADEQARLNREHNQNPEHRHHWRNGVGLKRIA
mgnify:CR=1 FL=1